LPGRELELLLPCGERLAALGSELARTRGLALAGLEQHAVTLRFAVLELVAAAPLVDLGLHDLRIPQRRVGLVLDDLGVLVLIVSLLRARERGSRRFVTRLCDVAGERFLLDCLHGGPGLLERLYPLGRLAACGERRHERQRRQSGSADHRVVSSGRVTGRGRAGLRPTLPGPARSREWARVARTRAAARRRAGRAARRPQARRRRRRLPKARCVPVAA